MAISELGGAEGRPLGEGMGAAAISQPTQKPKEKASLVLPFLSEVVDGVKPPCFTEGKQDLSGGTSSQGSAEGNAALSIQHVTSPGSGHSITLKSSLAVCLLCVLHNQLFAKTSQPLFP